MLHKANAVANTFFMVSLIRCENCIVKKVLNEDFDNCQKLMQSLERMTPAEKTHA